MYTRRGAGNDQVIRHRAALFIARADPDRPCVLRVTERELVPNPDAQLGNFGAANASPEESWVVTSEHMQGDAKKPMDLERTENRGANARVYCVLRGSGKPCQRCSYCLWPSLLLRLPTGMTPAASAQRPRTRLGSWCLTNGFLTR